MAWTRGEERRNFDDAEYLEETSDRQVRRQRLRSNVVVKKDIASRGVRKQDATDQSR